MTAKYRMKTKVDGINKQKKPKYYAVPVRSGEVNIRQIAEELAKRSTLTVADVYATIVGMVPVIEFYLHNGYSVRLDDFGIFSLSVSSEGYDNPDKCTPHRVRAQKICFRADVHLKKNLKNVKFQKDRKRK